MEKLLEENIKHWFELSRSGRFLEAKDFYFETLFDNVIDNFVENTKGKAKKVDVLFSVLGFTPEPIILTQRALEAKEHVIFYTASNDDSFEKDINPYLQKYLKDYKLVRFRDESFKTIYNTLSEQMKLLPAKEYALDITGGKKSMVASAAIFGRDMNFNVLYVDYSDYNPDLRRPTPGSEILNWVYDPYRDLPEFF